MLHAQYDWRLVALSVAIAIAASYTALDLAGRIAAARGWTRIAWLIGGAMAMGLGIWAMHYIGMLAYQLPLAVFYSFPMVGLSLLAAIVASAVALYVVSGKELKKAHLLAGSLTMGSGIAIMHYVGMRAMRVGAQRTYSPGMVTLSIVMAIAVSGVALFLAFRLRNENKHTVWMRPISAVVMGLAVAGMHYIGMAAVCFHDAAPMSGHGLINVSRLGVFCIATVTFTVLSLSFVASISRSRFMRQQHLLDLQQSHGAMMEKEIAARKQAEAEVRQAYERMEELVAQRTAELHESQAKWHGLIEALPQLIWMSDSQGALIFVSDECTRYTGSAPAELLGLEFLNYVLPDDRDLVLSTTAAGVEARSSYHHEMRLRSKSGEYRWFYSWAQPVFDVEGEAPTRWIGYSTDIDDQKRSNRLLEEAVAQRTSALEEVMKRTAELQVTQAKWKGLVAALPQLIWMTGRDGQITFVSEECTRYSGMLEKRLLGRTFMSYVHPDDLERVMAAALAGRASQTAYQQELRLLSRDGVYRWFISRTLPLFEVEGEPPTQWLGCATDIDDQRRSKELLEEAAVQRTVALQEAMEQSAALQVSQATWRGLVAALPQLIWVVDPRRFTTFVSDACLRYTGATREQLLGKGFLEYIHPEDQGTMGTIMLNAFWEGTGWDTEFRLRSKDGIYRWFVSSARPISEVEGEHPTQWVGSSTDIDDRKRSKELLEEAVAQRTAALEEALVRVEHAARAKSDFLAVMSHEIRTPMNGVIGMAHLMTNTPLTPTQRGYLDAIRSSGQALLTIINDILDFSKIEAGKLEIYDETFDLHTVAAECVELLRPATTQKKLALSLVLTEETPRQVVGDSGRLRQILLNLLGNAVKFTAAGAVSLTVSCKVRDGGEEVLHFAVKDSGIGLSPKQIGTLFQAFTQADKSTTRQFGGTGLGLSIGKRLVELMDGQIGVESQMGEGSTFWFELPLRIGQATASEDAAHDVLVTRQSMKDQFAGSGLRVLIADDVMTNQMVARGLLGELGLSADAVSNGAEAIAVLDTIHYDLVLMDVHMPEMDGLEATRQIRQRSWDAEGQKRRLPIIALTASAMPGDRQKFLEAGMDDFISKPIMPTALVALLRKWLPTTDTVAMPASVAVAPVRLHTDGVCVFDRAGLLSRVMGDGQLARLVMEGFAQDMPRHVETLIQTMRQGNLEEVADLAHRIRGAAATVGGEAVRAITEEMETAGRAGDRAQVEAAGEKLAAEFGRLLEALAEERLDLLAA